jgi:hypothetical protein
MLESNWIENRFTYASCYAKTIVPRQEETFIRHHPLMIP